MTIAWHHRLAVAVATLGGVGYVSKAPGTMGTLATVPLWFLGREGGEWGVFILFLLVSLFGVPAAEIAGRLTQRQDPQEVVIDEAAGFLLTMLWAPTGWLWVIPGFLLFRLFDIWKPWPVNWLDHNIPGGWGIMADDWAAGLYAGSIMQLIGHFVQFPGVEVITL